MDKTFHTEVDWTVKVEKNGTRHHKLEVKLFNIPDADPSDIDQLKIRVKNPIRNVYHTFKVNNKHKTVEGTITNITEDEDEYSATIPLNLNRLNEEYSLNLHNQEKFSVTIKFKELGKDMHCGHNLYKFRNNFDSYLGASSTNLTFELPKLHWSKRFIFWAASLRGNTENRGGYFILPSEGQTPNIEVIWGLVRITYNVRGVMDGAADFNFMTRPVFMTIASFIITFVLALIANYIYGKLFT